MNHIVFTVLDGVGPTGQQTWQLLVERPPVNGRRPMPFDVTGQEPELLAFAGLGAAAGPTVKAAGRRLFDAVMTNAQLAPSLTSALATQQPDRCPIYVSFTGAGLESLPWEALCSPEGDFLGLDERWALGRLVTSMSPIEPVWRLTPPVRIAAVISCIGVPGRDEWEALASACSAVPTATEILVLVGEPALFDAITGEAAPNVTVEFVPPTVADLQARVSQFRPHVLHLFCHGSAVDDVPHLEIAVKTDWMQPNLERSSLFVEAAEVRDLTPRTDALPWLAVLNCCETAAGGGGLAGRSMAYDLVFEGGIPAVVGMREPVSADKASVFTEAFYRALLPELGDRAPGGGHEGVPIDWSIALVKGRLSVAQTTAGPFTQVAASTKSWTLPVVYTAHAAPVGNPVVVAGGAGTAVAPPAPAPPAPAPPGGAAPGLSLHALRLQIEAIRGLLTQVSASADQALLDDLAATLASLTAQLDAAGG